MNIDCSGGIRPPNVAEENVREQSILKRSDVHLSVERPQMPGGLRCLWRRSLRGQANVAGLSCVGRAQRDPRLLQYGVSRPQLSVA